MDRAVDLTQSSRPDTEQRGWQMATIIRDYSLTGADSKAAVETGLAQADWYQTPIPRPRMKELMQRRDGPAIRDTLLWIGLLVGFGTVGALTWFSWVSVAALFCYGVLYGSSGDSRWHEAGHGTAFRTPWMNEAVYQIASFMMMRNPTAWRWSHARHHTDTIIVGRDPEIIAMRPPMLWKIIPNFLGIFDVPDSLGRMLRYAVGRLNADEKDYIPASEYHKVYREARVWVVIYAVTIAAVAALGSIIPLMLIGLPRMYGAWHHVMTGLTQHGGLADDVLDHRLNSRTIYMNPIGRFVYWNMNYHVEHHMYPLVPYHRLPDLHEEIKDDCVPASPGLLSAYREFGPVLWRQLKEPEFFIDRRPHLDAETPGTEA